MNADAKSIAFDDLRDADTISMQTLKSNYRFALLDRKNRKGLLSGGTFGDQAIEAFLTGIVCDGGCTVDTNELRTGTRAVFFVESKKNVRRVITSVITDLAVARNVVQANARSV